MSRPVLLIMVVIYLLMSLSGCSPLQVLNLAVNDDNYQRVLNQEYGPAPRQKLDIYIPKSVQANADVVIFYYGGRWQSGNREQYEFVADALTAKGMVVVLPDYRLYPAVDWPDFIQDGASAYQWVYKNIVRYHGNPKRIFIMGHSAGAHIGAMVSIKESLLGNNVNRPCGFIGLAGPYDFLPIADPDVQKVFSAANSELPITQPITFVSKGDPRMLLLHGKDDASVKPGNTIRLADRARRIGNKVDSVLYDDVGHVSLLISLSSLFRGYSPAFADSVSFISSTVC